MTTAAMLFEVCSRDDRRNRLCPRLATGQNTAARYKEAGLFFWIGERDEEKADTPYLRKKKNYGCYYGKTVFVGIELGAPEYDGGVVGLLDSDGLKEGGIEREGELLGAPESDG